MKIISVHCKDGTIKAPDKMLGGLMHDGSGLLINVEKSFTRASMKVRLQGGSLTALDSERSMGKAAAGAIAGGLLLGPLGLLAGGALGGSRKHTMVLNSPDARVIVEASTAEVQAFAGFGLPPAGEFDVGLHGTLPQFRLSAGPVLVMLIIAIVMLIKLPKITLGVLVVFLAVKYGSRWMSGGASTAGALREGTVPPTR